MLWDQDLKAVSPDIVIIARESRGLSQQELAEKLGITQGRMSKIEAGLLPVSEELLDRLADLLHYPRHLFSLTWKTVGVGVAELFHRKRQGVPKRILDKIHAQIELRSGLHLRNLLRSFDVPCNVPRLDIDEFDGRADRIAQIVRASWQLPSGPIRDLTTVIEDAGGIIVPFDFETKQIDAISRWIPGMPPLFFVNTMCPKDRVRYSLAHELGHIVMHELPSPTSEEQANEFASEFLLPFKDIVGDLYDLNLSRLALLKRYWKVSMQAILKRADDGGAITGNQARYLWAKMAGAGYRTREPVELDVQGEIPTLLRDLIRSYLTDLQYSVADLGQLLALEEDELWALYLRDEGQPPLRIIRPAGTAR